MTLSIPDAPPDLPLPGAVIGYRLYCTVVLILVGIVAPLLVWNITAQPSRFLEAAQGMGPEIVQSIQKQHDEEVAPARLLSFSLCGVMALAVGVALVLPRTPGAWVYHVVIICLGLGGWMLPFSVILLINWFQPKTQAYFGRSVPQPPAPTL